MRTRRQKKGFNAFLDMFFACAVPAVMMAVGGVSLLLALNGIGIAQIGRTAYLGLDAAASVPVFFLFRMNYTERSHV